MLNQQMRHQVNTTTPCRTDGTSQEEVMKRLFALIVMVTVTTLATSAFAGEMKMIGTVSSIKIVGSSAEMTLKDRKTDSLITLQVRDKSNMEKIKDRKVRVGDELRLRFDSDNKVIRTIQKTAGC
jgi:flagellar basal body-associated protein FliL